MRGDLRLRTLRAVEDKLGRLLDVLIDAEVGVPRSASAGSHTAPHSAHFGISATPSSDTPRVSGDAVVPTTLFSKTCAGAPFLSPRYYRSSWVGVASAQSRVLEHGITVENK